MGAPGRNSEAKILAYTKKAHIICISETWLKAEKNPPTFIGYKTVYRKDRANGDGGGILTLVRDDIKSELKPINMPQNTRIEAQIIEVSIAHDKMSILHLYNPEPNLNSNHLDMLIRQLGRKFVIIGDFNGHHSLWDPTVRTTNPCGRELSEYIIEHPNIALATTPGLKTHMSATPPHNTSTLDLTFCSNNLIQVTETRLLECYGSDHLPVLTKIRLAPDIIIREKRPKWKIVHEKITQWQSNLTPTLTTSDSINELENIFSKSLTDAAESTFKKTSGKIKTKYYKPWWNNECARAVAQRRRARKREERRPTMANFIDLRRCTANAKKIIKRTKRETWHSYCNTLTAYTPTKQVWDMVKKLNGVKVSNSIPIKENGTPIHDNKRKAEILADTLDETLGEDPTQISNEIRATIQEAKIQQANLEINSRFTLEELKESIKSTESNKAAGEDEIINLFLKNLPDHKLGELLSLINKTWRTSEVPITWKNALIMPIPKPGKDLSDPKSYRPISLLSCVGKTVEKMVNTRLTWYLENNTKYSPTQFGFRPGRSTEDLLVKVEHQIRSTLVNRKVSVAVFFDLKNAFDTINHEHILYKLANAGINGNMLRWIESFLKDRTYQVIVGNSKSERKLVKRGVPQGSCLSPTFFNIIMSDIIHPDTIIIGEYADDIAIIITEDTLEEAHSIAQATIQALENWAKTWSLVFNSTKTKSMCFTKKRIQEKLQDPNLILKVNNEEIEWVKTTKYLGATLDAPTLTWKKHHEDLAREAIQRLNIMRALSGTNWGANRELLINFYKAYIRSKLTYGAAATTSACQSRQMILERVQNAAMKVALGARKTTPIAAMQVEANLLPLQDHLKSHSLQYYHRKKAQGDQNPFINILEDDLQTRDKVWTHGIFKKPLARRIPDIIRDLGIPRDLQIKTTRISPDPPWHPPSIILKPDLLQEINKEDSAEKKRSAAIETINNLYIDHLHLYTDGSKVTQSTSAGLWIPEFQHRESWKLTHGPIRSIMGAELFAIDKGITWLLLHREILNTNRAVFLTDSRAGIETIKNNTPKHQSHIAHAIKQKAKLLSNYNMELTIQWLPSHVGVEGNEVVDQIAKQAHETHQETDAVIDTSEAKLLVSQAIQQRWQRIYDIQRPNLHIGPIKPKIEKWKWASVKDRRAETALSRLRLGHVGLNSHMHRFGMSETPLCTTCREQDTVKHFLTSCRKYVWSRRKMLRRLAEIGVRQPDCAILLGGGPFDPDIQAKIIKAVEIYLGETGMLGIL